MTILFDIHDQDWMSNSSVLASLKNIADGEIRFYPDLSGPQDIRMLACDRLRPGLVKQLPNLKLVQKLGAGVETIVNDPDLPAPVRIARVNSDSTAMEMARFCLGCVLNDVHHFDHYKAQQSLANWSQKEPLCPDDLIVAVLGLGQIGGATARLFTSVGFKVLGWSRTEKTIEDVDCHWGPNALDKVLSKSDYVISILPATKHTTRLFVRARFKIMKPGAMLVNVGRGSLIAEDDLIDALNAGRPAKAVLDVFETEPLSTDNPLWTHPGVIITPHVCGWHLEGGMEVVSDNYYRLHNDMDIRDEVSRESGY